MFWRRAKMRKAMERRDARSQTKLGSVERLVGAMDDGDVDAVVAALSGHHATHGTQNPSVEPLLLLRDPTCAKTLFHALLRLPTVTKSWPGFVSTLMTLLEHRQMHPASACALVAVEVPSFAGSAAIGSAIMSLRWGRPQEARELVQQYCEERDLRRLVIETLAEQDDDAKAQRLSEVRTEFARQGAMGAVPLLVAEAHCTSDPEKRNKLLRHLVVDHHATSFDTPAILSMPKAGEGPFRLFLVLADAHRRELPQAISMTVVSESEADARRWAKIFVPSATHLEAIALMSVDAQMSGLCLPWGAGALHHHQDVRLPIEDWTGLATLQRLHETHMPISDLLAFARGGQGPPSTPLRPSYIPPIHEAILRTGRFEAMGW